MKALRRIPLARSLATKAATPNLRDVAAAAMRQHGFEPDFPAAVIREVRSLDDPSDNAAPPQALDLRALPWSSVDNRESRDLDQIEVAERLRGLIRVASRRGRGAS